VHRETRRLEVSEPEIETIRERSRRAHNPGR
jgi:hypothetical protein